MKLLAKLFNKIEGSYDFLPLFNDYKRHALGDPVYVQTKTNNFNKQVEFLFEQLMEWAKAFSDISALLSVLKDNVDQFNDAPDLQKKFKQLLERLVLCIFYYTEIPLERKCEAFRYVSVNQVGVCAEGISNNLQDVIRVLETKSDEIIFYKDEILTQLIKEFAQFYQYDLINDVWAENYLKEKGEFLGITTLQESKEILFKDNETHIIIAFKNLLAGSADDFGLVEQTDHFASGYPIKDLLLELKETLFTRLGPLLVQRLVEIRSSHIAQSVSRGSYDVKGLMDYIESCFNRNHQELIDCCFNEEGEVYVDSSQNRKLIHLLTLEALIQDEYLDGNSLQQFDVPAIIDHQPVCIHLYFCKETYFFLACKQEGAKRNPLINLEFKDLFSLIDMNAVMRMPKPNRLEFFCRLLCCCPDPELGNLIYLLRSWNKKELVYVLNSSSFAENFKLAELNTVELLQFFSIVPKSNRFKLFMQSFFLEKFKKTDFNYTTFIKLYNSIADKDKYSFLTLEQVSEKLLGLTLQFKDLENLYFALAQEDYIRYITHPNFIKILLAITLTFSDVETFTCSLPDEKRKEFYSIFFYENDLRNFYFCAQEIIQIISYMNDSESLAFIRVAAARLVLIPWETDEIIDLMCLLKDKEAWNLLQYGFLSEKLKELKFSTSGFIDFVKALAEVRRLEFLKLEIIQAKLQSIPFFLEDLLSLLELCCEHERTELIKLPFFQERLRVLTLSFEDIVAMLALMDRETRIEFLRMPVIRNKFIKPDGSISYVNNSLSGEQLKDLIDLLKLDCSKHDSLLEEFKKTSNEMTESLYQALLDCINPKRKLSINCVFFPASGGNTTNETDEPESYLDRHSKRI